MLTKEIKEWAELHGIYECDDPYSPEYHSDEADEYEDKNELAHELRCEFYDENYGIY